jgi:hypothetical protein
MPNTPPALYPTELQLSRMSERIDKTTPNGCWVWGGDKNRAGYGTITIFAKRAHSKRLGRVFTHRVMWTETHGEIPSGMCVLHRCDNPPCCNPNHLFLGTYADNSNDKVRKNRQARGTQLPQSRLTEATVKEILVAYAAGIPAATLARRFNVHHETVGYVLRGKTWAHVIGPRPTQQERHLLGRQARKKDKKGQS